MIDAISFERDALRYLDQRFLPLKEVRVATRDYKRVIEAIKTLAIRGAPLIGIAAGYAVVLAARQFKGKKKNFRAHLFKAIQEIEASRPTAVNLFFATARLKRVIDAELAQSDIPELAQKLEREARLIHDEEIERCELIARNGLRLLQQEFSHVLPFQRLTVLTHCNTGELATGGVGTAFGVIARAWEAGLIEKVYASETRPLLQGLRLTAYELEKAQIPFEVVSDSSAAFLMQKAMIDFVIVGADRIAANGDVANKIGTYAHAVAAHFHGRKFFVAAPISTIDFAIADGSQIPIERRANLELTRIYGRSVAKDNLPALNFAFDITPHSLVSAIITDKGVLKPNFADAIAELAPEQTESYDNA
ncbi:MAG: S-methyl-5-thioribose-1-phosphate isomerase [Chloroherpetonaceae bacterium]|nr:S-methyl-5-thioribose-1-phosphate isomerase [Chloroherpetonaceae bacterium]